MKIIRIVMVLLLVTTLSLLSSPQVARAATKTWIGGTTGFWNDGANWLPAGVPASTDDIVIDGDGGIDSMVTLITNVTIDGSLTIDSGDILVILCPNMLYVEGTIENAGTIYNESPINNNGTIENYGTIDNEGTIDNSDGTINNPGTINNNCGAIFIEGDFTGSPPIDTCNYPPIANDDLYSTSQGVTLNVDAPGVLKNDSDPNNDTFFADGNTLPSNGLLALNPDGSFTYTPDSGFIGDDSFNYTASDGNGTDTALVTITVKTLKKLDLEVIQAPMKDKAIYHIGASMDGLPVGVTLHSATALRWVQGQGMFSEDIMSRMFAFAMFDGHLRIGVQEPENDLFYQFVLVYDDNGTPRYGTCSVLNEYNKNWPK